VVSRDSLPIRYYERDVSTFGTRCGTALTNKARASRRLIYLQRPILLALYRGHMQQGRSQFRRESPRLSLREIAGKRR
jgi:hypothetical protein